MHPLARWRCGFTALLVAAAAPLEVPAQPNALQEYAQQMSGGESETELQLGRECLAAREQHPERAATAVDWFRRSANRGNLAATYELAVCHVEGIGTAPNPAEGIRLLTAATEKGSGDAAAYLGWMYLSGTGVAPDVEQGLKWHRRGAELNNPVSLLQLGDEHLSGEHVKKDVTEALRLLRASAALGNSDAMTRVANLLDAGELVARDPVEAVKWYTVLATNDDAPAQRRLGLMYLDGDGVTKNFNLGVQWLKHAERQGDEEAKAKLAELRAANAAFVKEKQTLAEKGDVEAQIELGAFHSRRDRTPETLAESLKWLHAAANQGHARAQFTLAAVLESAADTNEKRIEALAWYQVASAGYPKAADAARVLEVRLSPEERAKAEQRAEILRLQLAGK